MAPPARSLGALLALVGAVVGGSAGLSQPPPGAKDLCEFEIPTDANCSLEVTSSEPCKIYLLPKNSCYSTWSDCSYIEIENYTHKFDGEKYTTTLKIFNYNGKHLLITTVQPEVTWWLVDVPDEGGSVTITGLLGRLNDTKPIKLLNYCKGCPPPRISYIAPRKLHKFEIFVSPFDDDSDGIVSVSMASSNDTGFSKKSCEDPHINLSEVAHGMTNNILSVEKVYSTEFCFLIDVNFTSGNNFIQRGYSCGHQENMTEPPLRPVKASIKPPKWWVVSLVVLIICLVLCSFVPLAIYKRVLRVPCGRSAARRKRPEGGGGDGSEGACAGTDGRPLLDGAPAPFGGTTAAHANGESYSLVRKGMQPTSVDSRNSMKGAEDRRATRQPEGTVRR